MISAHSHWEKADICDMSRPQELTRTMNGATLVFLVPSVYNFLLALRILEVVKLRKVHVISDSTSLILENL